MSLTPTPQTRTIKPVTHSLFCFMASPVQVLQSKFGYETFRFHQKDIIDAIMKKHDVFVLMPTGGGKSLCYQIPALLMDGLTVVISPLIALMKDQVDALRLNGVSAVYLNSSLDAAEAADIYKQLRKGEIKLLYVSPERLIQNNQQFLVYLRELNVSLVAIDEAHCISHWGHDFRPEYRMLSNLKMHFPKVPTIALTATADHLTREDILSKLKLKNPKVFVSSFNRPNIKYTIAPKRSMYESIISYLRKHPDDSGIIYVLSRNSAEKMAEKLTEDGYSARAYHAGLTPEKRQRNQEAFLKDRVKIMVATIAFGMGINKSNVRFVIHADLPKNIESYYQETGRAGRDGLNSDAILYYSGGDVTKLKKFAMVEDNPEQTRVMLHKLSQMATLCEANACRRRAVLNYFGEEAPDECGNCDVCLTTKETFDATVIAQKALSAVARLESRYGLTYVVDFLRGSKSEKIQEHHKELKTYGIGKDISKEAWYLYFKDLLAMNYLRQAGTEYPILALTEKSRDVLLGKEKVFLVKKELSSKDTGLSEQAYEHELFDILRQVRTEVAQSENVPAYLIFSDSTLVELATYLPATLEEMRKISGFGDIKLEKYGTIFLEPITQYMADHQLTSLIHNKRPKR